MKMKTSNLGGLAMDYVMTSIANPDALRFGVEDWREQRRQGTDSRGEYLHRYGSNWNLIGPFLRSHDILVGPSPFPSGQFAAGVGSHWDGCKHIMTAVSYELAICRTVVAREKGQEVDVPLSLWTLEDLELQYIDAAAELRSKQAQHGNYHDELDAFIEVRDALRGHTEFSGQLPQTFFSGGDLDPDGVPEGGDAAPQHVAPRG